MENQFLIGKHIKKICIIVPVYNSEKYLGYCLNSILSQTYTNWNAILVDDGSTDGSLEICHSYEAIDSRFRVFSKKNGGVSSTRNFGLHYADGDYLEFLDSDDCLAPDALEKQVFLATLNNSQLVVTNMLLVDFQNPNSSHIMLNSAWLEKSPCVLSAEEFKQKRMRLIWYTALMEGPCAKLYDLDLWKKLDIRFPENMSFGEDFMANMTYYDVCNKVVFLNECGYYYNKSNGSGSLTDKYRSDLFELKMYLIENLEKHLGGHDKLSESERDAFYCYTASSGFTAVEQLVLNSNMDEKRMIERLREMFSHPIFVDAARNAEYIPERFAGSVQFALNGQFEEVIAHIVHANQKIIDSSEMSVPSPGLLNRVIRKSMRLMARVSGNEAMVDKLTRVEREVAQYGLKNTWRRYAHANQRVTKACLEEIRGQVNADVDDNVQKLKQNMDELQKYIEHGIDEQQEQLNAQINKSTAVLKQKLESIEAQLEEKSENIVAEKAEMINGYTWMAEQRMTRYSYLRDINELRQKKKAIMLATAEHSNIGDAAITLAEQQLLGTLFPEYFQVEISTYEFNQKEAYLHAILNPKDILFINGGGNIGDLYQQEERLHRKIISEFPDHKIIILPQTISFSDSENGQSELEKSQRIYNRHRDLTLFVRGKMNFEFAKRHFSKVRTVIMPDTVHALSNTYAFDRKGALLSIRNDVEGILNADQRAEIIEIAEKLTGSVEYRTNMHTEDIPRDIRGLIVRSELMRYSSHQVVITDRLHGMIFSAVTETPCVVLSTYNHKIRDYYETFFKDSNAIFFIGDEIDKLEEAIVAALQVEKSNYPVFDRKDLNRMREIIDEKA